MAPEPHAGSGAALVLGTAQLGLAYGITNRQGQPSAAEAEDILDTAGRLGVSMLDTARAYGTSEAVIGRYLASHTGPCPFQVLTKLAPDLGESDDRDGMMAATRTSLQASRAALGTARLDCVMLHRPAHLALGGGVVMDLLRAERDAGRIGRLGVSLSEPAELLGVLEDPDITHVQFPFNLLDHRFDGQEVQDRLDARPDVQVHVRSVFLQGLIVAGTKAQLHQNFGPEGARIAGFLDTLPDRLHAALGYVRAMPWVHGLVVGAASAQELTEIATAFQAPVDHALVAHVRQHRPVLGEAILNPARWPALT